jgi:hypothetical protein
MIVLAGTAGWQRSDRLCGWVCVRREGLHRALQVQGDVQVRAPRLPRPLEGGEGERSLQSLLGYMLTATPLCGWTLRNC